MLVLTRGEFYFIYSSYYKVISWVCAGNGVNNAGIVLVIAEQCLQSQGIFCFSYVPIGGEARGAQESWRLSRQGSWSQLTKGIFHTIKCYSRCRKWEQEGSGIHQHKGGG